MDGFSGDSLWYVQRLPGESRSGQLLYYNLGNLERNSLPALSASPVVWISPPAGVIPDSYSLSGRVLDEAGEPQVAVNILLDDQPAATSDEQGQFTLTGLKAGKYHLSALKAGLVFTPEEQSIRLPDDAEEILFTARPEFCRPRGARDCPHPHAHPDCNQQ